jgi:hypothetical protein
MTTINLLAMMMSANLARSAHKIATPRVNDIGALTATIIHQEEDFYYCPKNGKPNPIPERKHTTYYPRCWSQISFISEESEAAIDFVRWQPFLKYKSWPKTSGEATIYCQAKAEHHSDPIIKKASPSSDYRDGYCGVELI